MDDLFMIPHSYSSIADLDNFQEDEYCLPENLRPVRVNSHGEFYPKKYRRALVTRIYEMASANDGSGGRAALNRRCIKWCVEKNSDALWTPTLRSCTYEEWIEMDRDRNG